MLESYDSEILTPKPRATMFPAPTPIGSHRFERPAGEDEDHWLPDNDRIYIQAMSRANENPAVKPAQPDVFPSLRSTTK
jgi:hypothetical protein